MSRSRRISIATWLGTAAVVLAVAPAVLLASVALRDLSRREEERARERIAQVARAVSGEIRRFLDAQVIHLTEVSITARGPGSTRLAELDQQLTLHLRANPALRSVLLVDRKGRVVLAEPDDPDQLGTDLSGQPWLQVAWETGLPTWSEATVSQRSGEPMATLVVPDSPWTVVGYLDLAALGEMVGRVGKDGPVGAAVLDRHGTVLAGLGPGHVDEHASLRDLGPVTQAIGGREGSGVVTLDGVQQVVGVAIVPEVGWLVMVSEPVEAVVAKLGTSRHLLLAVLAAGVAIALLAAGLMARRIVRPARDLADRARALAAGSAGGASGAAVREREQDLRRVLDTALDAHWVVDPEGRFLDLNPAACELTGYTRDELLARRIFDVVADDAPEEVSRRIRRIVEEGSGRFDSSVRRKDGTVVRVSVSVRFNPAGGGRLVAFLRDVTERRRAQEQLQASEAQLRDLIQNLRAGVVVHAPDTSIVLANPAASTMLGLSVEQMRGKDAVDPAWRFVREDASTMPPEEFPVARVVGTGRPVVDQVIGIDRPATRDRVWVQVNAFPVHGQEGQLLRVVVTFVDITARVRSEADRSAVQAQMAMASRLAAMGTLVAGAAHEINNPLAATIAGQGHALEQARGLRTRLDGTGPLAREATEEVLDDVVDALEDAQAGAQRVAQIVRDLTALGRPNPIRTRVALADVARDALRWLPPSVSRLASVEVQDLGAPDVAASAGQLGQVVVNLVSNAAKATPEGKHGEIVLRVGPGRPGMARLEVVDRGSGIEPAMRERIFEPFFTTRPVGPRKGSGGGLAICHAIVAGHGGTIEVESTVGQGSTFRVELPAAAA
jgi:PAS domain S-box-containing protein